MDIKIAARMIAVFALGAGLTAAIVALQDEDTTDASSFRIRRPGGEPVNTGLSRCRDLGMAAADDAACRKAWAESRRRFFATDRLAPPKTGEVPSP
ncbi:putative entry exclusion protein TrbK-alt [Rhizobium leguminosarum]|uniref:putative entry exclusion protein TrbK-alt n=1 Tax=Rhizobium leguminosarum TaxID=384 RepID=UPI001CDB83BB|nr:putative entry exclusion protein TrbK-alt [Rhizobium leguminosarum]MCA2411268.1 putative entry exclusion protein TrbK-alt [Rhizobium leguminosarum]